MTTAEAIHDFPVDVLAGCETALVVFAAAFGGAQDAAHIRDAGLRATCIDVDDEALFAMRPDYPDDWTFISFDVLATEFVGSYDVVTLDPFRGDMMTRTLEQLPRFAACARKVLIVGRDDTPLRAPEGWRPDFSVERGPGVFWTVLVPA